MAFMDSAYQWARRLRASRIAYELIDHLDIFTNYTQPVLRWRHAQLLKRASVVIGTSDDLVCELAQQRSDAVLCPNGVDTEHFARFSSSTSDFVIPADMQAIVSESKPIIGYYGALAEWFDYELVKHAARALPDYWFVLIGPDYDFSIERSGITDLPNISWLGPKAYAELPSYLHMFDVATIPFKTSEALQAVSPIKLFEYMAGQRPIVTTDLLECRKYSVVAIARTPDEWVAKLQEARARRFDPSFQAALRATAEQNTWRQRAKTIVAALAQLELDPASYSQ
jgi:glycosyltransferase involved in cell wall biosynthesis